MATEGESSKEAAPVPASTARGAASMMSGLTILIVFLLLLGEGIVVYVVTSYVQAPKDQTTDTMSRMEFVDLGEITTMLSLEGTSTSRYFRLSVSVYLSDKDREETKLMIERLKPKLRDEIQSVMMQESYPNVRHPESKRRIKDKIKDLLAATLGPGRIDEVVLPSYEPQ